MIPFSVMSSKKLGLPAGTHKEANMKEMIFSYTGGLQMDDNEISLKRTMLNLVTFQELRAAHVFHYAEHEVKWNTFEPAEEPLNKAEVNGQVITTIQAMKEGQMTSEIRIDSISRQCIKNKAPIIKFLNQFNKEDRLYIILVFKEMIFSTGNYFDESTLCKSMIRYKPTKGKQKMVWPEMNSLKRLQSKAKESFRRPTYKESFRRPTFMDVIRTRSAY